MKIHTDTPGYAGTNAGKCGCRGGSVKPMQFMVSAVSHQYVMRAGTTFQFTYPIPRIYTVLGKEFESFECAGELEYSFQTRSLSCNFKEKLDRDRKSEQEGVPD